MADSTHPTIAAPLIAKGAEAADAGRNTVFWLTSVSHAINHIQNQMVSVLYPIIMVELGFGYAQLGVLTAVRNIMGNTTQGFYGFVTPFFRRTHLLGVGNLVIGLGTMLSGFAQSYMGFLGARSVAAMGTSAQHPVGTTMLAKSFPEKRGMILALSNTVAGVGSLVAPLAGGLLLMVIGWRQVFFLVAFLSLAMGIAYFAVRNRAGALGSRPESQKGGLGQGKASYWRVLRNRKMMLISVVMMIGGAGRGEGVNVTYIAPHLVNDLFISVALTGLALSVMQFGGAVGPLGIGWLSDRFSRKGVLQLSLLFSCLATLWLAFQGAHLAILLLNLFVYGMFTQSRAILTQSLVADSVPEADHDAAFSVYYFIGFVSVPFWTLLVGFLMQSRGFSVALSVLSVSYIIGMLLLFLFKQPSRQAQQN